MSTDITGQKYGKLTAIKLYHTTRNGAFWLCQCECGNTCVASEDNLKAGRMTSCRCVRESKRSLIGKNSENLQSLLRLMKGILMAQYFMNACATVARLPLLEATTLRMETPFPVVVLQNKLWMLEEQN